MTKENKGNPDVEKILEIIINILKIIKNRNRTYIDKLFGGEKEIILEQESLINSMIFDTNMILFISKIQNLYDESQFNINELEKKQGYSFYNIFSLFEEKNNINDININEHIKLLILSFNDLFSEDNIKSIFQTNDIPLDSFLYLIKFYVFSNYFYYIYSFIKN